MATKIFPSFNDVGPVAGDGRIPTEDNLSALQKTSYPQISRSRRGNEKFSSGGVISGYDVSGVAGLVVTLTAGEAVIDGYHIEDDATKNTPTLTASTFNWVFLALTKNAGLVTGVELQVTTSTTYSAALVSVPADAILIWVFETDGTTVINQFDLRASPSNMIIGSYVGNGAATRSIDLGFRPSLVHVHRLTVPRLFASSGVHWPFPSTPQFGPYALQRVAGAGTATGLGNTADFVPVLTDTGFDIEDGPAAIAPGGHIQFVNSSYDPATVGAGATVVDTFTVTGALLGDCVIVTHFEAQTDGLLMDGWVSNTDEVKIRFFNPTGIGIDSSASALVIIVVTRGTVNDGHALNELNAFYFFSAWF